MTRDTEQTTNPAIPETSNQPTSQIFTEVPARKQVHGMCDLQHVLHLIEKGPAHAERAMLSGLPLETLVVHNVVIAII